MDNICKICGGTIEKIEIENGDIVKVCVCCECTYDYKEKEGEYNGTR